MVRLIGELEEARIKKASGSHEAFRTVRVSHELAGHIMEAFQSHVPVVKGVPVSMSD